MTPSQEPQWQPEEVAPEAPSKTPAVQDAIEWQASEYIHHDKGPLWYIVLVLIALAAIAVSAWFQAWTFLALIIVMAIAVAIYAGRAPHTLSYLLGPDGLTINDRHYDYSDFRSFGVVPDGGLYSIILMPTKRFMPSITIYFPEEEGEKIVDMLGKKLPMEELGHDFIERLTRRLHF